METQTDNVRRFVFKNTDGNPLILSRAEIRLGKARGILRRGLNHMEIEKYAIYDTIKDRR